MKIAMLTVVAVLAASSKLQPIPRAKDIPQLDLGNKTVDEMREFWNALGYEEGICVYNPDVLSGGIRWRRCLVDKRDNRKAPE